MKIESRTSEVVQNLPSGKRMDYIPGRQRSFTSDPFGNSTGKTDETASAMTGKGNGVNSNSVPDPIDVENAVEKLNELVQSQKTNVSFSVDEDANATVIKVFKTETGELIKQYPPEEILAMKAKVNETVGLLYDHKV